MWKVTFLLGKRGEFFLKEEPVLLQWRELVWKHCCQSSIALLSSPARRQYCLADCISYWKNDSGDIDGQLAHRSHNLRHTDSRTKTTYNANHFSPDSKLLKARWFTFTFALVQFPFPTPYVTTDAKNVRKMQVSWQETFAKDFFSVEWDWIDQRCEQWPKTLTNISLASAKLINYLKKVKICPNCQVIKVLVFVSSYSLVSSTLLYLLYDLNSKTFTRWSKGENWWILNKWSALRPNDKLPATFMT